MIHLRLGLRVHDLLILLAQFILGTGCLIVILAIVSKFPSTKRSTSPKLPDTRPSARSTQEKAQ